MNIGMIFNKLKYNKTLARIAMKVVKRLPEICLVGGMTTGVAATITTAVQTTKLEPILDKHKAAMDDIKEKDLEESQERRETAKVYARTVKDVGKLYAVPIVLEAASLGLQVGGHHVLRKENAALAAAYIGINKAFKDYRDKVKATDGPAKDIQNLGGEIAKDENSGEEVVIVNDKLSPYARLFDAGNENWTKNADMNMSFLKSQMITANSLFHQRGFLFLNEVYDLLGIDRSKLGQRVGWVEGAGDDFIDFGLYNVINKNAVDEFEPAVWLDFNVDGDIMYIFDYLKDKDHIDAHMTDYERKV